ncbi:hypothetical protein PCE1_001825 [Barthelona sp. PCE]
MPRRKPLPIPDDFQMFDGWLDQLNILRRWRTDHKAPVDEMGAHCIPRSPEGTPEHRFQLLLGLMLSSQTKDPVTFKAMDNIHELVAPEPLSADSISKYTEEEVHDCIRSVGFHNRKSDYIQRATKIIKEEYDGDLPTEYNDIVALPGVGQKMAILALQIGYNKCVGVSVDTHVHRLTKRLGWRPEWKEPKKTSRYLTETIPEQEWHDINHVLVGFGQLVCDAKKPKCDICPIYSSCVSEDKRDIGDIEDIE